MVELPDSPDTGLIHVSSLRMIFICSNLLDASSLADESRKRFSVGDQFIGVCCAG